MTKRNRKYRPAPRQRTRVVRQRAQGKNSPKTAAEFFARSADFQDQWARITHVISKMRGDRVSLAHAAREFGLDPRTVIRWGSSALNKSPTGRYVATKSDRLLRVLFLPTEYGTREVATRDSRQASKVAEYWDAVQGYLQRGDKSALRNFRGVRIRAASGESISLLTEPEELDRLGNAGVLSFESLYARSA